MDEFLFDENEDYFETLLDDESRDLQKMFWLNFCDTRITMRVDKIKAFEYRAKSLKKAVKNFEERMRKQEDFLISKYPTLFNSENVTFNSTILDTVQQIHIILQEIKNCRDSVLRLKQEVEEMKEYREKIKNVFFL